MVGVMDKTPVSAQALTRSLIGTVCIEEMMRGWERGYDTAVGAGETMVDLLKSLCHLVQERERERAWALCYWQQ